MFVFLSKCNQNWCRQKVWLWWDNNSNVCFSCIQPNKKFKITKFKNWNFCEAKNLFRMTGGPWTKDGGQKLSSKTIIHFIRCKINDVSMTVKRTYKNDRIGDIWIQNDGDIWKWPNMSPDSYVLHFSMPYQRPLASEIK